MDRESRENTKYYLGLEKSQQIKKYIQKLRTADGRTLTEVRDILQEEVTFYQTLYTTKKYKA